MTPRGKVLRCDELAIGDELPCCASVGACGRHHLSIGRELRRTRFDRDVLWRLRVDDVRARVSVARQPEDDQGVAER